MRETARQRWYCRVLQMKLDALQHLDSRSTAATLCALGLWLMLHRSYWGFQFLTFCLFIYLSFIIPFL